VEVVARELEHHLGLDRPETDVVLEVIVLQIRLQFGTCADGPQYFSHGLIGVNVLPILAPKLIHSFLSCFRFHEIEEFVQFYFAPCVIFEYFVQI